MSTDRENSTRTTVSFLKTIPLLRICDVGKAKPIDVDFLGFAVEGEHHFDENTPASIQVSRGVILLHLTKHQGGGGPGSTVFVGMTAIDEFPREVSSRGYK